MKSTKVKIGNLEFHARLAGKDYVPIEKRLNESIHNVVFGYKMDEDSMNVPPMGKMIVILSGTCKTSNISERKIALAIENLIETGKGTKYDVYEQMMQILNDSGFFGQTEESEETMEPQLELL
ncbi:MAG: DUF6096 family protein [Streptococcaceae bacterium]|jgi:hypothetical protein|nr:DUF6096 family protein [Streptococcaceae bacterium]